MGTVIYGTGIYREGSGRRLFRRIHDPMLVNSKETKSLHIVDEIVRTMKEGKTYIIEIRIKEEKEK